jgi:hypothetical protein
VAILGKDTPVVEEEMTFKSILLFEFQIFFRSKHTNHDARETDYLLRMEEKQRMGGGRGIVWQHRTALRGARAMDKGRAGFPPPPCHI